MATSETREITQPPARAKPKARIARVTGNTRGVGAAIGRSLARQLDGWASPDAVARVIRFPFADVCSLITGRVWALDGRGAM